MTSQTPLLPYVKFPANLPPLPVRRDDDSGGPMYVTNAVIAHESAQGLTLTGTTQTGATVTIRIAIVAPGIAHVVREDAASDPNRVTLARNVSGQSVLVSLEKADGQIKLLSHDITIEIDLNPFRIAFSRPDGRLLLSQNCTDTDVTDRLTGLPFGFSEIDGQQVAFHDTFAAEPDEHFYGFGEKFTGFDKRGQRLAMWNYDAFGAHSERATKMSHSPSAHAVMAFLSTAYGRSVSTWRPTVTPFSASQCRGQRIRLLRDHWPQSQDHHYPLRRVGQFSNPPA